MSSRRAQKTLTVMFTDISGFTKHTETISREALMQRIEAHNALLMPIVAHFEGRVVKSIGDALLVVFESPTNAVLCGMLMQHRLARWNAEKAAAEQIHVKVSLNAGEVTVTEDDVFGDAVNVAAKIEKATSPDEIYFTEAVFLAMNKAEVPNAFVKTFRPKGAESQEIKLYRVLQDEAEPVYARIVNGTHIDEAKVQARVLELSSLAEKEVTRWQEAVTHLAESSRRSQKALLLLGVLGVLVLGGAVLAGFALFGAKPPAEDPVQKVVDGARAYLAAGKPEEARALAEQGVAAHGRTGALQALEAEVVRYESNALKRAAVATYTAGRPADVVRLLDGAPVALASRETLEILRRARLWLEAEQSLAAGRAAKALEQVQAVGEEGGLTSEALAGLRRRAEALAQVQGGLAKPDDGQAGALVDRLSAAYGDDVRDPAALKALSGALERLLFSLAQASGPEAAAARMTELRKRFPGLTDWSRVEREADLGGLWEYTRTRRREWLQGGSSDWEAVMGRLRRAAEGDAAFQFRLGEARWAISKQNDLAIADGMSDIAAACAKDPALLDTKAERLLELALDWLQWEQGVGSFGRTLLRDRFFERARDTLVKGLRATAERASGVEPNVEMRASCLAILADKGEAGRVDDAAKFLVEALDAFVLGSEPQLTAAHARALLALPMSEEGFTEAAGLLEGLWAAAQKKEGRYGAYQDAAGRLGDLLAWLRELQPGHAGKHLPGR